VGVPAEPVTVTLAVREPPKAIGLAGTRVGTETVGVAALTGCMFMNAQIDSEIRNTIIRVCSFFMFFILLFLIDWDLGVNCLLKDNVLLVLTFPNLVRSEMCIHNKDKVD
jgi:hypothetical protein